VGFLNLIITLFTFVLFVSCGNKTELKEEIPTFTSSRIPLSELSFESALSRSASSSFATAEESDPIYIEGGNQPSKVDKQVFDLLAELQVNPDLHPYVWRWKETVSAAEEKERLKWGVSKKVNKVNVPKLELPEEEI